LEFGIKSSGFIIQGLTLEFSAYGSSFRVYGFGFQVTDFGFRV